MKFFKRSIYFLLIISLLSPSSFAFYSSRKISSVDETVRIDNQKMKLKIDEKQKQKIIDLFSEKHSVFKNYTDSLSQHWKKRRQRQMQIQQVKHFTGQASHLAAFILALTVVGSVKHQINLARQSGKDFSWEWLQSAVTEGSIHAIDNGHIFAGLVGAGVVGKTIQVGGAQGKKIADKIRKHRKLLDAGKTRSSYNKIAKKQFVRLISVTAMTIITFLGWEVASEFFAQSAHKTQSKRLKLIEKKSFTEFLVKNLNVVKKNNFFKLKQEDPFHIIAQSYLSLKYKDILKTYYNIDIEKVRVNKDFLEKINLSLIEELMRLYFSTSGANFNSAEALKVIQDSGLSEELKKEYKEMAEDPHLYEKIISNIGTDRNGRVTLQMLETFFDEDSQILYDAFRKRVFSGQFVTFTLGLSLGAFASTMIPGIGLSASVARFAATIGFVSLFVFGIPQKYQDSMTSWMHKKRVDLSMSKIIVEQNKILQDYKDWITTDRNLGFIKNSIKRRFERLRNLRERAVHVASEMIPKSLITIFQKYSSIALINQTLDEVYLPKINAFSIHYHIHESDLNSVKIALKERQKFSCTESSKVANYNECSSDSNEDKEVKIFFSDLSEKSKEKLRKERDEIVKELKTLEKNFYPVQYDVLRIYADQWRFFDYINRQIKYFDSINYSDQAGINERKIELSKLFESETKSLLDLYKTHAFVTNTIIQTDPRSCLHQLVSSDNNIQDLSGDRNLKRLIVDKDNRVVELYSDYIHELYQASGKSKANKLSYQDVKSKLDQAQSTFHSYINSRYGSLSSLLENAFYLYSNYWGGSASNPIAYTEREELKFNSINNESLSVIQFLAYEDEFRNSVRTELALSEKKHSCILNVRAIPIKMQKLNEKPDFSGCKLALKNYERYLFQCIN